MSKLTAYWRYPETPMIRFALAASALILTVVADPKPAFSQALPARFEAGRVFLDETTASGQPIVFFTDTGGGRMITQAAAERLGLSLTPASPSGEGGMIGTAPAPVLAAGAVTPPPPAGPVAVAAGSQIPGWPVDYDMLLGGSWFADRIWTLDYPAGRMVVETADWRPPAEAVVLPLGFQVRDGARTTHFPRIEVRIDGDAVSLLLDTGATTVLTPEAVSALADGGPQARATSMISDTLFQRWRAAHPDWRVIEAAQVGTGSAMIEVPEVRIGALTVGPVWFTHRPDRAFHGFMGQFMDARIEGALGGNAFDGLVLTIDYPGSRAAFARP